MSVLRRQGTVTAVDGQAVASVSRRAVIGGGVVVLGAVALGVGDSAVAARAEATGPVRSDFAPSLGEVFTATSGSRTAQVRLTHVRDIGTPTDEERAHSFILIFAPLGGAELKDGIYGLRRSGVRTHDLFVSSVGPGRTMQAVVNGMAA